MTEVFFTGLGYFTKSDCEAIKKDMQGYSYMNFNVSYANYAGNCTLIVRSDRPNTSAEDLRDTFLHCIVSKYADTLNERV